MFEPARPAVGGLTCVVISTGSSTKNPYAWRLDVTHRVTVFRTNQGVNGTPERTLAYGTTFRRGYFRCTSRMSGLTCASTYSGHGFFLSRSKQRTF
jgi:hypothetical protein